MKYIETFLYNIIQYIKSIVNNNYNIIKFSKFYVSIYIILIIIVNMLLVIYFRKIKYDKNLLKIYKLLKNKNFFSDKFIKNLKRKIRNNKILIINFYDDKNIKLFNFIRREIKKKYNLNNVETQNIIFYLYQQIDNLNNLQN
jgi:hypothetical protein